MLFRSVSQSRYMLEEGGGGSRMKFRSPLPAQTNVSRALTTTEFKEASSGYARLQAVGLLAPSLQKNLTLHQVAHQPSPHQHLLTVLESRCTYYSLNTELPPKISKATISNISIIGSRKFKKRLKPLPKLIFSASINPLQKSQECFTTY